MPMLKRYQFVEIDDDNGVGLMPSSKTVEGIRESRSGN